MKLSGDFVQQAIFFAFHSLGTTYPGTRAKFWSKGVADDYLKTCGLNKQYIRKVLDAAADPSPNALPPLRPFWEPQSGLDTFEILHYAPMHMLFLGIVKAVYELLQMWLQLNKLLSPFG